MTFPTNDALLGVTYILYIKMLSKVFWQTLPKPGAERGCIIPNAESREKFRAKVNIYGALSVSYVTNEEPNYTKHCRDLNLCHPAGMSVLLIANVTWSFSGIPSPIFTRFSSG